jgi:hypothetical protein
MNPTTPLPKKRRGRPEKPPERLLVGRSIRLTPEQWEEFDSHGIDWLRRMLDRCRAERLSSVTENPDQ